MKHNFRNTLILLIIACYRILYAVIYIEDFSASTYLIYSLGLGEPYFNSGNMVVLISDLFPVFIIQFLEGISIYKHFCLGSDYYFSRQENRRIWLLKEIIRMFLRILCCFVIYFIFSFIIPCLWYSSTASLNEILMIIYIIFYFILYTFLISIWINIFSILYGSQVGLIIVYIIQLGFIFTLLLFEKTLSLDSGFVWILKLNPIANMIISWHSINGINSQYLNIYQIKFNVNYSIIYYMILILISIKIAIKVVEKQDIALQNREVVG